LLQHFGIDRRPGCIPALCTIWDLAKGYLCHLDSSFWRYFPPKSRSGGQEKAKGQSNDRTGLMGVSRTPLSVSVTACQGSVRTCQTRTSSPRWLESRMQ
jgi:hypothetical protein